MGHLLYHDAFTWVFNIFLSKAHSHLFVTHSGVWLPYLGVPGPLKDINPDATHACIEGMGAGNEPWGVDGGGFSDPQRSVPSPITDMFRAGLWSPACTANHCDKLADNGNAQLVTVHSHIFAPE